VLQVLRIAALVLVAMLGMAPAEAVTPPAARNIVLVQSVDGTPWTAVIPLLEAAGLKVTTIAHSPEANPLRHMLELQDGPTVLVGHAASGAAVSEVGSDPKVSALVYVAAPAPGPVEKKPSFYAVAQQGEALSPETQRSTAARMKAKTIVLDSLAAHPREIAGLILEAAGLRPAACAAEGDNGTSACAAQALPRSLMEGCRCTKDSSDPTLP
jgi:hypothetical protein